MKNPLFWLLALFFTAGAVHTAVAAGDTYVEGEVIVTFKPGFGPGEAAKTLDKHALRLERRFERITPGRVTGLVRDRKSTTAELIARLRNDPRVESVEPDYLRRVSSLHTEPGFNNLWGFENSGQRLNGTTGTAGADVRFLLAWKMNHNPEAEVVIGVIDTGVDITHPDLAANIWRNPAEIAGNGRDDDGNGHVDDVHGFDFAQNSPAVTDSGDHGTHVAGTIAAVGGNGIGVVGIDSHARILPLKVSTDGQTMRSSAIIAAMNYCVALKQRGVNIVAVNGSYGGSSFSTTERNAILALRDAGIIFVAAAGNDGSNNDTSPLYPASYASSNIIAVASLNQNNSLSSFSNFGATSVHLAAPGSNIYSTVPVAGVAATSALAVSGTNYGAAPLTHSPTTAPLTGTLHHCGIGTANDFPAAVRGNIALIERGTITFAEKVTHAMNAGATAAIIYDNTSNSLPSSGSGWTLGSAGSWIPALQITRETGLNLIARLPAAASLSITRDPALAYKFQNGTSMAAPAVAGALAFAARNFPHETMDQRIARILDHTAPVAALAGKTITGGRLDLLRIIDTDLDGLPDWWEMLHFGSLALSSGDDPNGNGVPNLTEYLNGTNPAAPALVADDDTPPPPPIRSIATLSTGDARHFAISFPSVAGASYQIEWSSTLAADSWLPLGPPVAGTGDEIQIVDPADMAAHPRRYYRLARITAR
jgi:subtilisin family serine protease